MILFLYDPVMVDACYYTLLTLLALLCKPRVDLKVD